METMTLPCEAPEKLRRTTICAVRRSSGNRIAQRFGYLCISELEICTGVGRACPENVVY